MNLADSSSLDQTYLHQTMSGPGKNKISLLFGIDSAIQVGGVGTGALDPLRGCIGHGKRAMCSGRWRARFGLMVWKVQWNCIWVDLMGRPMPKC